MNGASLKSLMTRALSAVMAASLLVLSPGPQALTAFAQSVQTGAAMPANAGVPAIPVLNNSLGRQADLRLDGASLVLPSLSPAALPAPTIKSRNAPRAAPSAQATAPQVPAAARSPKLPSSSAAKPAQAPAPAQNAVRGPRRAGVSAMETLRAGAQDLARSQSPSETRASLDSLFTGAKSAAFGSPVDVPESGDSPAGLALERPAAALGELEAAAIDQAKPEGERKEAVAAIAKQGGAQAQESLKRVAAANPEGGASDYEVHRAALRALADSGVILSLRPVSRAHAGEILARLARNKPGLAIFDYDDTLQDWMQPLSQETAQALKSASDAGVRTAILTDRPDAADKAGATILDSLDPMTPEQKAGLAVQSSRGTRTLIFDRRGEGQLVNDETVRWTQAEKKAIVEAADALSLRYGRAEREDTTAYSYFRTLPLGLPKDEVEEAARLLQSALKARGVDYEVVGRLAKYPEKDPPYLTLSKVDKSIGVAWMRAHLAFVERLQDAARWGLSGRWLARAGKLLRLLPERSVPAGNTLLVGDQFFDAKVTDRNMTKGAPGALSISVGAAADPRIDNIFVWPSQGPAGSLEILRALGKTEPSGMNKKALFGFFASRTVSIAVFILTTIAYPFIAVPVVGWAGYGALMALGPVAAIAAGPLNGRLADRLSARSAMTLNAVLRAAMNMALPVLALLGFLNFWSLLLASFANGWLLSSMMTTENAYVKALSGPKNVGAVNGLAWMNYLAIQVLLGLILGVGSVIDAWNPGTAFLLSAAVHALVVAPILYFTMPDVKNEARVPPAPREDGAGVRARALSFLSRHWLPALLLAGTVLLYAFSGPAIAALSSAMALPAFAAALLKSTLPITAALMFWISRGDSFKSLWAGGGREVSPAERAIEARIREAERAGRLDEAGALAKDLRRHQLRLRSAMLFISLAALMFYPLQSFVLPLVAQTLVGAAAKGLLLGQFTGALFLGNLLSTSAQAKLPELRLPLLGRVPGQRLIQAAVIGLGALWLYTRMLPGNLLAAGAAALAMAGLIKLAGGLSNRSWVRLFGLGFSAIWLPFLAWVMPGAIPLFSIPAAVMLSLLAIGMFYGPGFVSLNSYFQTNAEQKSMGSLIGAQGSLTNAAISIGYGLVSMLAASLSPALPALLAFCGAAYIAAALVFWRSPAKLPGLPGQK